MMGKRFIKAISFGITVSLLLSTLAGCGSSKTAGDTSKNTSATSSAASSSSELPMLEYTVFYQNDNAMTWNNQDSDVVAKEIENKFKIKCKEIITNQGMSFKEKLNLLLASNQVPDVVFTINDNSTIPETGKYAELGDSIKENCPNLMKLYPESEWGDTLYKGKMYVFPKLFIDGTNPNYVNDLYTNPTGNWAQIWTKESVLKKLGYSFTPIADIYKKVNETQTKPTADDFKITPAIATPEDFYNFLKKIKEVMPKVNGKDIIPFTMPVWLEPHFGAMFGLTGQWKYNTDTKKVSEFLGDEQAKPYWQYLNKLYKDGLLDRDFAIQKNEQIQEKAVQGRVACSMWYPDLTKAQEAVKQADPNDSLRSIPLPMQPGTNYAGIDGVSKATFKYFIRKDFPDIPRLLKLFDWTLSTEASELKFWGPESLGLWEMKDGKKVWKDQELYKALVAQDDKTLDEKYYKYGLGDNRGNPSSMSIAGLPFMVINPGDWKRSYPLVVDANDVQYQNNYVSSKGIDWNGKIASGVDDVTSLAPTYIFGEFEQQHSAKLFAAKTDEEFNKNFDEELKYYKEKMKYDEAKAKMEEVFAERGLEVVK